MRIYPVIYIFFLMVFLSCGGENMETNIDNSADDSNTVAEISKGESLFNSKCLICHIKNKPEGKFVNNLSAPPMTRVIFHLKEAFYDSIANIVNYEDAEAFISDYVLYPSEEKAICKPSRIKAFGLMPSLKGSVTDEELEDIAAFMMRDFPLDELLETKGDGK